MMVRGGEKPDQRRPRSERWRGNRPSWRSATTAGSRRSLENLPVGTTLVDGVTARPLAGTLADGKSLQGTRLRIGNLLGQVRLDVRSVFQALGSPCGDCSLRALTVRVQALAQDIACACDLADLNPAFERLLGHGCSSCRSVGGRVKAGGHEPSAGAGRAVGSIRPRAVACRASCGRHRSARSARPRSLRPASTSVDRGLPVTRRGSRPGW